MGSRATSGEKAYEISLTKENFLGDGNYSDVYKIRRLENDAVRAAKFYKVPKSFMDSLD